MKNQKGFSLVEGLLILVIVGLLGGTGWYVWNARTKTTDTLNNTDKASSSVSKYPKKEVQNSSAATKDPTSDWTAYSNKEGSFSLKHPKSWIEASNPQFCTPGLLLLGSDSKSV